MKSADTPNIPFPSITALRAEHERMQVALGSEAAVREAVQEVLDFVTKAVRTGTRLDAKDDRRSAQAVINYWVSRGSTASRNTPHLFDEVGVDTILADFEPDTYTEAVVNADRWVRKQPPEDQALARRIIFRLVRLTTSGEFEPVPTSRLNLRELADDKRLDAVVKELADYGVLSVTAGSSAESDRVALRSADMLAKGTVFGEMAEQRRDIRKRAEEWDRTDRPKALLYSADDLDDARACSDRSDVERRFVDESRRREVLRGEWDRQMKWVNGSIALLLLVGLVTLAFLGLGWLSAYKTEKSARVEATTARRDAEEALREIEANAISASISNLAVTAMWLTEKPGAIHVAKKLLILQTLRQVLFAPTPTSAKVALANWKQLEMELCEKDLDNSHRAWFTNYLRVTHGMDIDRILNGTPNDRKAVDNLRMLSQDLKQYFNSPEAKAAIATVSQSVVYDAGEVAKRIAVAADNGRGLDECRADRRAFWRLDCLGLVLAVPDNSPADLAAKAFAEALRQWEEDGTVASPERVQALKNSAEYLSTAFKTVDRPPTDIDPLKDRMEQKNEDDPRE